MSAFMTCRIDVIHHKSLVLSQEIRHLQYKKNKNIHIKEEITFYLEQKLSSREATFLLRGQIQDFHWGGGYTHAH